MSLYTPSKTSKYENLVRLAALCAMSGRLPVEGAVEIVVRAFLAVPESWSAGRKRLALSGATRPAKRPDLDNIIKAALDGMNGIVFRDDKQVVDIRADKRYDISPRLEVECLEIGR